MSDAIVTIEEAVLAKSPKEVLDFASNVLADTAYALSDLLRRDLSFGDTALFHDWCKKASKSLKSFEELLNERTKAAVIANGSKVTEKGTLELDVGDGKVQRVIPTKTTPDNELTERVLRDRGLSVESWMRRTVVYKADETLLKKLLENKMITEQEYKKCFGEVKYKLDKIRMKDEESDD